MAPNSAPISIPTVDVAMVNGVADSQAWDGGRSPARGGAGDLPRRSSRSRSPGRGNGDDRGCVFNLVLPISMSLMTTRPAVTVVETILAITFMFLA
jgi:hypothetical protein